MMLVILGWMIIGWSIFMIARYKRHPKLSIATGIILTATICQICPDIVWIGLIIATAVNAHKQKAITAL